MRRDAFDGLRWFAFGGGVARACRRDLTATQRYMHPLESLLGPLGAEGYRVYHSRVWNCVVQLERVFAWSNYVAIGVKRWSIPIRSGIRC